MITNGAARVVLIGKSKNGKTKSNNILQDINPTEIPKQYIDSITVTFDTDQVMEFDTTNLEENFTVDGMTEWLNKIDRKGRIQLVEVTLDLDLIMTSLQEGSDSIFAKYF
jgi:hypothetical protein